MPQRAKGPRLYRHPGTGIYQIRDSNGFFRSTGARDVREAEAALGRYIAERDRPRGGPATPESMTVAEALTLYGEEHAPTCADPARIGYAIDGLLPFWGNLPVSAVTAATCRRYVTERGRSIGTVRKELGTLKSALRWCEKEGRLTRAPVVELPKRPPSRDRHLSRHEVARLIHAAWRNPKAQHLARFILVALYTGTRKDAVLRLRFDPNVNGGWVDVEAGLLYRRGQGQAETKKRTPPARIPRHLLAHLKRWRASGARHVVEIGGQRVGSIKTAWRTAVEQAGIEWCTPHVLRHTAITWSMQRGARPADVCGFFGVSLETLERTYWHHHPDHQESAVRAMERKL